MKKSAKTIEIKVERTLLAPLDEVFDGWLNPKIPSPDAPCFIAASVWTVMQPSHRKVTATARAISSRVFASRWFVFVPAALKVL